MQSQQQEKLKSLIAKSPILNDTERSEWLMLLDLMDDKQAGELEKILTGASQPPQAARPETKPEERPPHPLLVEKKNPQPGQAINSPVVPGLKIKPPAGLDFSHIMNFPQVQNRGAKKEGSIAEVSAKLAQQKPKAKAVPNFSENLKTMLAEKELPAGHPEPQNELELPAPGGKASAVQAGPEQKARPLLVPKPKAPVAAQVAAVKVEKSLPVGIMNRPDSRHMTMSMGGAKPSPAPSPVLKEKTEPPVGPATSSLKLLEKERAEALSSIKLTAKKPGVEPKKEEAKITLKEPKDAATLDAKLLHRYDLGSLTTKLKSLIRHYGYHDVVFNIEHSPLYKAYITTGTKLLQQQTTFEQLDETENSDYLGREDFEQVADLLHQIQAG